MATSKNKCTGCKNRFPTGEMITVPAGKFHSKECMFEYATNKRNKSKLVKTGQKEQRKDLAARKDKIKTKPELIKEAQVAVNSYIRARDSNKPCISCQVETIQKRGGTMDAGHYRSRGSAGHLRFNILNIHSQCVTCNRWQSGNVVDYRINLIKRIGLDQVEKLEGDNRPRIFTFEYLRRIKKIFNKRANWYKKRRGL